MELFCKTTIHTVEQTIHRIKVVVQRYANILRRFPFFIFLFSSFLDFHRKEREEEFFALNLGIKSESLEASLEQFIQGEMLEGENAYLCEDCNEKVKKTKKQISKYVTG